MSRYFIVILFLLTATTVGCSSAENYKDAYKIEANGKSYIKLRGKRKLMAHDPFSLIKNETYEDSVLLALASFKNGVILGKDIPVEPGHYQFLGKLQVDDDHLYVDLYLDNTDDNKKEPYSWNGNYIIVNK